MHNDIHCGNTHNTMDYYDSLYIFTNTCKIQSLRVHMSTSSNVQLLDLDMYMVSIHMLSKATYMPQIYLHHIDDAIEKCLGTHITIYMIRYGFWKL